MSLDINHITITSSGLPKARNLRVTRAFMTLSHQRDMANVLHLKEKYL